MKDRKLTYPLRAVALQLSGSDQSSLAYNVVDVTGRGVCGPLPPDLAARITTLLNAFALAPTDQLSAITAQDSEPAA
jgi:hypothetical protein